MAASIQPVRVNHFNAVIEDFDASVAHLAQTFDADFLMDLPAPGFHAWLFEVGRVIFEGFAPRDWLLISRYGPHYLGIEYQADMDEVRAAIADHGIRIVRDIGLAVHTHPADCFGIAFEFFGGYFHDNNELLAKPMRSAAWWADEHPLGLLGLKAYTVAVGDSAAASAFFTSFLSAKPVYEEERPDIAAHAIGLQVSDCIVELLTPTGAGELDGHLRRFGDGIRSVVFAVRNIAAARAQLESMGLTVKQGSRPGALAISAAQNQGLIFEFAE